ncbi:MAG: sigma-70 family RNA polymerase sigma factor [Chitinivibrionales bacterium]|nr:sigma-70 family RNA polymerase sigma factor [Chitinivibrionales bacterium]
MQEQAFNALYGRYATRLYNYLLCLTHNRAMSEDILQTVFVNVWHTEAAPVDEKECAHWLFAIAHNACFDMFRKNSRFSHLRLRYAHEKSLARNPDSDTGSAWEMLTALPELERSIIYLNIKMGYTYREIAPIVRTSENNVRIRAFRALKKLRQRFIKEKNYEL